MCVCLVWCCYHRGYSDYRRADKFCEYCKWQLVKYKSWSKEYEQLYDNDVILAPLAYLEFLEGDAPITLPRRESDLHRLHQYFSRDAKDPTDNFDDPDEDHQPWEKGPITGLQQVLGILWWLASVHVCLKIFQSVHVSTRMVIS